MALAVGSRIGAFEITGTLGAGGMGEVYRARDTRLDRDVAIKVLPELYAQDPERLARFEREAKALASLNHPNIAAIYGLEKSPAEAGRSVRSLVLELVEGPTLADRIAEGPLPVHEAMAVARQVADALQAAHDLGVIHRDLKPANIKLRPDGTVKVLDFGLAKMLEREPASPSQTVSPTLSVQATLAGVILGTAGYMSPEQARGKTVDRRTDIWSFGCVLFEMLTGKRAFDGEDLTVTIAAVVRADPDWSALPADVPPSIRLLLKRCLEKEPRARIAGIEVARFLMTESMAAQGELEPATNEASAAQAEVAASVVRREMTATLRRRTLVGAVIGVCVGAALALLVGWALMASKSQPSPASTRFAIVPPALLFNQEQRDIAISPDGSRVVYTIRAGGLSALVVRALDQLEGQTLPGTEGGRFPFFSPDSRWIGFFTTTGVASEIKKIPISGGSARTVARLQGFPRGASWGDDDKIVFASSDLSTGLLVVPASGGEPTVLTKPDAAKGEIDHQYPSVLPGGKAVLYTIAGGSGSPMRRQVAVFSVETGQRTTLLDGRYADYLDSGRLLYSSSLGNELLAVTFDLGSLRTTSEPVSVLQHYSAGDFSVARNGTLAYIGADGTPNALRSLVWVSKQGREETISAPPRAYTLVRLSPDGTKVVLDVRDQGNDVWTWDLARQVLTQVTFDPSDDRNPVWVDNDRIIFASARTGVLDLYGQRADGTGSPEVVLSSGQFTLPTKTTRRSPRTDIGSRINRLKKAGWKCSSGRCPTSTSFA